MSLTLEKYKGPATRHICPSCGKRREFTRYINTDTGEYLADEVGKCNRDQKCGYHYKPSQYFANNGQEQTVQWPWVKSRPTARKTQKRVTPDTTYHAYEDMRRTLGNYEQNDFVQFLLDLFPGDAAEVESVISDYLLGTDIDGNVIFWQIDQQKRIRAGKVMRYDRETGKRQVVRSWIDRKTGEFEELKGWWMHKELKLDDFKLEQCFFGTHLLNKYPDRPIAICESEKTAIIAAICKGSFPDLVWLATGGLGNFNAERLIAIGCDRPIVIYPDAGCFQKWQQAALDASRRGVPVRVSEMIERAATNEEKAIGFDLADVLIRQQREKLSALDELIAEREAIMAESGATEAQIADYLCSQDFEITAWDAVAG